MSRQRFKSMCLSSSVLSWERDMTVGNSATSLAVHRDRSVWQLSHTPPLRWRTVAEPLHFRFESGS